MEIDSLIEFRIVLKVKNTILEVVSANALTKMIALSVNPWIKPVTGMSVVAYAGIVFDFSQYDVLYLRFFDNAIFSSWSSIDLKKKSFLEYNGN